MSDNPNDELPDEQPSDDFANFDPAAYVAKHNEEMGRHLSSNDPVNQEVRVLIKVAASEEVVAADCVTKTSSERKMYQSA
jgi:hypothetical protein